MIYNHLSNLGLLINSPRLLIEFGDKKFGDSSIDDNMYVVESLAKQEFVTLSEFSRWVKENSEKIIKITNTETKTVQSFTISELAC